MAQLVLKIKYKETLRRWVVSSISDANSEFPVSFDKLKSKIQELFQVPPNSALAITYVDKEGDTITMADDQDLIDACVFQSLNPLKLNVEILQDGIKANFTSENGQHSSSKASANESPKVPLAQVTAETIKEHINKYTHALEASLQPALLFRNIKVAWGDVLKTFAQQGRRMTPDFVNGDPTQPRSPFSPNQKESDKTFSPNHILHVGVKCDECGMYPIQGVRFRSLKIFNYDLCGGCFEKLGNEHDYERIENPVSPLHFLNSPSGRLSLLRKWRNSVASGTDGWKSECPFIQKHSVKPVEISNNLNSVFVKDLTEHVAKELFPGTQFTKIWRLKNNGTSSWPNGTQIINIGGEDMSTDDVVLKLPEEGLLVGEEFDAIIDFKAPDHPGNYVSHWRLMSPSDQIFGQTLWVALQVSPLPQSENGAEPQYQNNDENQCKYTPANQICQQESSNKTIYANHESCEHNSKPLEHDNQKIEDDDLYSIDEKDGFSIIEKSFHGLENGHIADASTVKARLSEMQLLELQTMGFTNRKLNAMLLENNNGDLQLTLDNLIMAAGFENLLKDLQEMGFEDMDTNLLLLIKNEGSIKRVVKELVDMEKHN